MALLRDFRTILRHVGKLPATKAGDVSFRRAVVDRFRAGKLEKDQAERRRLRRRAADYAAVIVNVAEQQRNHRLRELDAGADVDAKDSVKNAAARAGLAIHTSDYVPPKSEVDI